MSSATENEMGELHSVMVKNLTDKIKNGEATERDYECARKLLSDSGIEASPNNKKIKRLAKVVDLPFMTEDAVEN